MTKRGIFFDDEFGIPYFAQESNPARKEYLKRAVEMYQTGIPQEMKLDFEKAYRKHVWPIVKSIYIDLPMLIDIYLGGLLLMTQDTRYGLPHIVDYINNYNARVTPEPAKYFPYLGVNDKQLFEFIMKPENSMELLAYSPPTTFWKSLKELHRRVTLENARLLGVNPGEIKENDRVQYVINTWPAIFTDDAYRALKIKFCKGIGDDNITFGGFSEYYPKMVEEQYAGHDYIFAYLFDKWFARDKDDESVIEMSSGKFYETKVFAYPFITNDEIHAEGYIPNLNEYREIYTSTMKYFNLVTSFQYYRPRIAVFDEAKKELDSAINEMTDELEVYADNIERNHK